MENSSNFAISVIEQNMYFIILIISAIVSIIATFQRIIKFHTGIIVVSRLTFVLTIISLLFKISMLNLKTIFYFGLFLNIIALFVSLFLLSLNKEKSIFQNDPLIKRIIYIFTEIVYLALVFVLIILF